MTTYWAIEEGRIDPATFFRELPRHFPDATTIFFEGTSIEPDVKDCFAAHIQSGPHLPGRQTIWPKAEVFRCKFSPTICMELEALSRRHAVPELCDHLYVYRGEASVLEFPDFCANEIFLPISTTESAVGALASVFGLKYWRHG
jgi:hypothetical protein